MITISNGLEDLANPETGSKKVLAKQMMEADLILMVSFVVECCIIKERIKKAMGGLVYLLNLFVLDG